MGQNLAAVGEPMLAFYNPPMLRRNEIMLELA
jgi:hypothetical protein